MKAFNKLVRDKIPDMIRAHNETPLTRVLEIEERGGFGDRIFLIGKE